MCSDVFCVFVCASVCKFSHFSSPQTKDLSSVRNASQRVGRLHRNCDSQSSLVYIWKPLVTVFVCLVIYIFILHSEYISCQSQWSSGSENDQIRKRERKRREEEEGGRF